MNKKEKFLPKSFIEELKIKKPQFTEEYSAKAHSYKGIFTRVNLPKKIVQNMGIQNGDTLKFRIQKETINNKEKLVFYSWVEK